MIFNIKNIVIATTVSLIAGYVGGWYVSYKFYSGREAKQIVKQLEEVRKDDARAVADSQAKSEAIQDDVKSTESVSKSNQEQAQQHVERSRPKPKVPFSVEGEGLRFSSQPEPLTYGLICVLNAARENRTANCPAPGSDEALRTVTAATFAAFVANDLQVVEKYHVLAKRHDALVDYVLELQADQRKRLGLDEPTPQVDETAVYGN